MDFQKIKRVHFVGIGGIGISAIARMFLLEGKIVSGTDIAESPVVEDLKRAGAEIAIGQGKELIPADAEVIVYTVALEKYDPDFLKHIKNLPTPNLSYPEVLKKISEEKYTIAVAGTHGKTTTTAMLATILEKAGLDPTAIVGSLVLDWHSNYRAGRSKYFVVEADEYKRAFLNLSPKILVITNVDNDHLDYYHDLADIQSAFAELVQKIPADGFLICNPADPNVAPVVAKAKCQVINYELRTTNYELKLKFPGNHNVLNAKAALAASSCLDVSPSTALGALNKFSGTWRRFEYKGKMKSGALVYDDYAHNPAKIRAALAGAREKFGSAKIIAVFHPHLYSRTKLLFSDFGKAFTDANEVIVAPIFAAREVDDGVVTSESLALEISKNGTSAVALPDFDSIILHLKEKAKKGDIALLIGAGDIYKIADNLLAP